MQLFSQRFFSIYFNAAIIVSVLLMVIKILRNLFIEKTIRNLIQLPDDRKERITRLYRRIISMQRIGLWIMPFGFLFVLAAFILLFVFPELTSGFDIDIRQFVLLMGILMIVGYIHFIEASLYKKKILKAIDQS